MKRRAVFITGTDTDIGKTFVTAGLSLCLSSRGIDVGVMKPIATGGIKLNNHIISADAAFLKKASGSRDKISLINPFCSKFPLSPNVAFKLEKKRVLIAKIKSCFNELLLRHEFVLVEGIGGLLVPIDGKYLVADLIRDLDIPLLIVSANKLGTINHTLLTIKQAREYGCSILGVVFNNPTKQKASLSQKTNPAVIKKSIGVDVLGELPFSKSINIEKDVLGDIESIVEDNINIKLILRKVNRHSSASRQHVLSKSNKKYVWHPFTQMMDWQREEPLIIQEAKGSYLKDVKGRWFLDGISSLWVNIHGHRRKEIDDAVKEQVNRVSHSTLLGLANEPSIELAERLIAIVPKGLTKVFYSDNGSTSVEVALKMAFQYWQGKVADKKKKTQFVYLNNSYHGDTIGGVSVGGIGLFHSIFHPLLFNSYKVEAPYCYRCPVDKKYPSCKLACLNQLKHVLAKNHKMIAALIIEPLVQGAGGMIVWPKGVLSTMRKLCDKYDVLLIADEVAVGFGRTGKMFACEHENIVPDIMCLSKGLSGGYLPLAVTLSKERIYEEFLGDYSQKKTFFHGHSYTGNPLACACALASLDVFKKDKTLQRIQAKILLAELELKKFKKLLHVGDVRQKGLMIGIELIRDKRTKEKFLWSEKIGIKVIKEVRKYGIILRPLGNCIVLMPPLSIAKQELKYLLDKTYEVIKVVTEE